MNLCKIRVNSTSTVAEKSWDDYEFVQQVVAQIPWRTNIKLLDKINDQKPSELSVLDIGCGEGKDAVYLAQKGCDVTAFEITESGICKTKKLAKNHGVKIDAFVADINDFKIEKQFDIVYSTGTIQYLFDENIDLFFRKIV